jgi:dihydropteroate synthase
MPARRPWSCSGLAKLGGVDRPQRTWSLGAGARLDLEQPRAAGVVNVTVDSMFAGARSGTPEQAVADGLRLVEAGFDLLDVGAVAARSGPPVPAEEEAAALIPAIEGLAAGARPATVEEPAAAPAPPSRGSFCPPEAKKEPRGGGGRAGAGAAGAGVPISADTFSAEVARLALDAGAVAINDIGGGSDGMFELVGERGCGYVLMHIEGPPRVDRPWRRYADVVDHLKAWFEGRVELARELGVAEEQIAIDPGLDFDLSPAQNLEILRRLGELRSLGLPLYVSLSRKDFVGAVLAGSWERRLPPEEREWGTVAAVALAVRAGADVLRIHDRSSLQALRVAGQIVRPVRSA